MIYFNAICLGDFFQNKLMAVYDTFWHKTEFLVDFYKTNHCVLQRYVGNLFDASSVLSWHLISEHTVYIWYTYSVHIVYTRYFFYIKSEVFFLSYSSFRCWFFEDKRKKFKKKIFGSHVMMLKVQCGMYIEKW